MPLARAQFTISDLNDPIVQSSAPTNPVAGMLWLNTTTGVLSRYDGSAWKPVVSNAVAAQAVTIDEANGLKVSQSGLGTYFQANAAKFGLYKTSGNAPVAEAGVLNGEAYFAVNRLKDTTNTNSTSYFYVTTENNELHLRLMCLDSFSGTGMEYANQLEIYGRNGYLNEEGVWTDDRYGGVVARGPLKLYSEESVDIQGHMTLGEGMINLHAPAAATHDANIVEQVRNIIVSTTTPANASEGSVWLKI